MKYPSLTTPDIEHDEANLLTELLWLNRDLSTDMFPWRGEFGKEWGRTVAIFRKLMGPNFELSPEQLAFYLYKCRPQKISSQEFAKMAVVSKRLFLRYDLEEVCRLYGDKRKIAKSSGIENVQYKQEKPKTLLSFLRELERGETKES